MSFFPLNWIFIRLSDAKYAPGHLPRPHACRDDIQRRGGHRGRERIPEIIAIISLFLLELSVQCLPYLGGGVGALGDEVQSRGISEGDTMEVDTSIGVTLKQIIVENTGYLDWLFICPPCRRSGGRIQRRRGQAHWQRWRKGRTWGRTRGPRRCRGRRSRTRRRGRRRREPGIGQQLEYRALIGQ